MTEEFSLISRAQVDALVNADCDDVFALLGLHAWEAGESQDGFVLRAYFPGATEVVAVSPDETRDIVKLGLIRDGVFAAWVDAEEAFAYKFRVCYDDWQEVREDPYRFASTLDETDVYLFSEGTHERLYDWMGAHLWEVDGIRGTRFCVWAPNARRVSVVGVFNFWDGRQHPMRKHPGSGLWEIFIPGVEQGALYKYEIKTRWGEVLPQKADPYGFAAELLPGKASKVVASQYQWHDHDWMTSRERANGLNNPIAIYEVHLGSWRRVYEEGNRYLNYRELAAELIPYVKEMGFTHIQLMPVSEYPFDGSWGYQPVGLYAPTSRFGEPDDFRYFIDRCHQAQLGVLVDWVPGHFPSDPHGLAWFDGTPLYEHADPRQGFHPDWNTYIYNYGRREVANFLFSNALYWYDEFHIDGLRVDAVASMLYLDYSRESGEWVPNHYGGRENLEAIDLLKRVNSTVYRQYPNAMMVAEESTAWPGVSHPVYAGGLGFGYKWNMGWMNDSLSYMEKEPIHRQFHHHELTFSLLYAFNENFILPLSHDEVVHGKRSLLDKMPGEGAQKFANLRAYYAFMWTHPGKKLLFMGGEFAQGREWGHDVSLDWHLLDVHFHEGVQRLVRDLNHFYKLNPAMHQLDCDSAGFEWIEADDRHNSIFAFLRKGEEGSLVLVVCNFTPVAREHYRLGVPCGGFYREAVNTDASLYGGGNFGNSGGLRAEPMGYHGRPWSVTMNVPPMGSLIFEWLG